MKIKKKPIEKVSWISYNIFYSFDSTIYLKNLRIYIISTFLENRIKYKYDILPVLDTKDYRSVLVVVRL